MMYTSGFRKETIEEVVNIFGIDKTVEVLHSMVTYHPCIDYLKLQIKDQLLHEDVKNTYDQISDHIGMSLTPCNENLILNNK